MNPAHKWLPVLLTVVLLVVGGASGCGSEATQVGPEGDHNGLEALVIDLETLEAINLANGDKLQVVATTNIVADIVAQVGRDRIELSTLMGIGVDPHSYVPTPADTAALHDAHLVLANGAGLESDMEGMFEAAGGEAVYVHLSDGLALRDGAGIDQTDEHAETDPHVWFDVQNVVHWTKRTRDALSALDPTNADVYAANASSYVDKLSELDAWVVAQVNTIPAENRKLVTSHPVFGYFGDRYGLEQVGAVYPISPSSEPSAQDIAALQQSIRQFGVPAVFAESTANSKLAELVAQDTGIQLVGLYTGSLGEPGSGAETYILLIEYDVQAIVDALG